MAHEIPIGFDWRIGVSSRVQVKEAVMTILGSLFASAVVATTSATPLPWFTLDDYPTKAFAREWQGVTSFDVIVDPAGRPADCKITKSSGHEMLDKQACYIAMKRTHFTPAYGADGTKAYGVFRTQVVWGRPDRDRSALQRDLGPDIDISVNQLPSTTSGPLGVKLAYMVDAQGNPSTCTPLPDSRAEPGPILDVACKALLEQIGRHPVTVAGTEVPAVRTAAVKITATK
jgi:TonB family protein